MFFKLREYGVIVFCPKNDKKIMVLMIFGLADELLPD